MVAQNFVYFFSLNTGTGQSWSWCWSRLIFHGSGFSQKKAAPAPQHWMQHCFLEFQIFFRGGGDQCYRYGLCRILTNKPDPHPGIPVMYNSMKMHLFICFCPFLTRPRGPGIPRVQNSHGLRLQRSNKYHQVRK